MVEKQRQEQFVEIGLWISVTTSFTEVMGKILQHSNLDYGSQMGYVTGYLTQSHKSTNKIIQLIEEGTWGGHDGKP